MKPYDSQPFTNDIGQVINPGDSVLIITSGRGKAFYTRVGTYLGTRQSTSYYGKDKRQVVCEGPARLFGKFDANGKRLSWDSPEAKHYEYTFKTVTRRTTLKCNRVYKLA